MTATLIGSFNLGDAIPGVQDALDSAGGALNDLKGVVDGALGTIGGLANQLDSSINDLNNAKDALLAGPVDVLNDALDAATEALDLLNAVTDPSAYLTGIINNLNDAVALLEGLIPADYLTDQLAGVTGAIAAAQARLDDGLAQIQDLTDISDAFGSITDGLRGVVTTLQNAANAAIDGIVAYTEQASNFLNSGVYVVQYTGALSSLGSEVDAVLPSTGIGSSDFVSGPLLIVKTSNAMTLASLNAAFGL